MEVMEQRYSTAELAEFKELINKKLSKARAELEDSLADMRGIGSNSTDDTAGTFKLFEDGYEASSKEERGLIVNRQKKFVEQLENALIRINNGTYGVCRITGTLIPKQRLMAVPHATLCIEAKNHLNS